MQTLNRNRVLYIILMLVAITIGMSSRWFPNAFPTFLSTYLGDTLWASVLYFTLAVIWPSKSVNFILITAFFISILVECSQLYQAEWINELRQFKVVALLLGRGFLWSDFLCYLTGVLIAGLVDLVILSRHRISRP